MASPVASPGVRFDVAADDAAGSSSVARERRPHEASYEVVGVSRRLALMHLDASHPRTVEEYTENVAEVVLHEHPDGSKTPETKVFPVRRRRPWSICGTRTGRFCPRACESYLCDPCGEGVLSELVGYGAGVTKYVAGMDGCAARGSNCSGGRGPGGRRGGGTRVRSYFKFLKWGSGVFLVLALVHLPPLVINTWGTGFREEGHTSPYPDMFLSTLGNLNDNYNVTDIFVPASVCIETLTPACAFRKSALGAVYTLIDFIGALIFLISIFWLKHFEAREIALVDDEVVSAEDYTVFIPDLPPWVSKDTLISHFHRVLRDERDRPLDINAVTLVQDEVRLLDLYVRRGDLVHEREKIGSKLSMHIHRIRTIGDQGCCRWCRTYDRALFDHMIQQYETSVAENLARAKEQELKLHLNNGNAPSPHESNNGNNGKAATTATDAVVVAPSDDVRTKKQQPSSSHETHPHSHRRQSHHEHNPAHTTQSASPVDGPDRRRGAKGGEGRKKSKHGSDDAEGQGGAGAPRKISGALSSAPRSSEDLKKEKETWRRKGGAAEEDGGEGKKRSAKGDKEKEKRSGGGGEKKKRTSGGVGGAGGASAPLPAMRRIMTAPTMEHEEMERKAEREEQERKRKTARQESLRWTPPMCTEARTVHDLIEESYKLKDKEMQTNRVIRRRLNASALDAARMDLEDLVERSKSCCCFGLLFFQRIAHLQQRVAVLGHMAADDEATVPPETLSAFVTFETEEGYMAAVREYPDSWLYQSFLQAEDHRLRPLAEDLLSKQACSSKEAVNDLSPVPIRVVPAPPPDTIIWENMAVSSWQRFWRQVVTLLLTIILLAISLAILYAASVQQANFIEGSNVSTSPCDQEAGSALSFPGEGSNSTSLECYCASVDYTSMSTEQLRLFPHASDCSSRYCRALAMRNVMEASQRSYCVSWVEQWAQLLAIVLASAIIVLVLNVLLIYEAEFLGHFEAHYTEDMKQIGIAWKMFLSMYVNTALLTTLANAYVPRLTQVGLQVRGYGDFSRSWYASVGTSLIVMVLFFIVSAHLGRIVAYIQLYQARKARSAPSQLDLNASYTGSQFDFPRRYAEVLTIAFACLTYAPGMPILFWVGFLSFFSSYWLDKFFLLRMHQTPPAYGGSLGRTMTSLLPAALIIHLAMALWMYSYTDLLPGQTSFLGGSILDSAASASRDATLAGGEDDDHAVIDAGVEGMSYAVVNRSTSTVLIPIAGLLALSVLFLCIRNVCSVLARPGLIVLSRLTCGCSDPYCEPEEDWENLPSFTDATSGHLPASKTIQGIREYDILKNPRYQALLGVSPEWAAEHSSLMDLANYTSEEALVTNRRRATLFAPSRSFIVIAHRKEQLAASAHAVHATSYPRVFADAV